MRNDELGRETRKKYPEYTCNGCDGTGQEMKWTLEPHHKGNITLVSKLLGEYNISTFVPFAIVTPITDPSDSKPERRWNERGKMGWWGLVTNEQDQDDWNRKASGILAEHKNCIAVLCDLHI